MRGPLLYDLTRLGSRFTRATPNGIDRIDLLYAERFLRADRSDVAGFLLTLPGPRPIPAQAGRALVKGIADHWGEQASAADDTVYQDLQQSLRVAAPMAGVDDPGVLRLRRPASAGTTARGWLRGGRAYLRAAVQRQACPRDAIYLNVSQFPIWNRPYFRWLKQQPGMRLVFLIHDLLPLTYPEFFPKSEEARHRARLDHVAESAAGVIVSSESVAEEVRAAVWAARRTSLQTLVAPFPVPVPAPATLPASVTTPDDRPYFVVCSTMEPRKNHLLLLHIWRALAEAYGAATPRLVIVGARGWNNDNVLDLLSRCPALRACVVEVSGLGTPALNALMRDARAVLMPTFAEGFGLPVHEALATGARVVAADIAPFQGLAGSRVRLLHPLDGPGWMRAIMDLAHAKVSTARPLASTPDAETYFAQVETFLEGL